MSSELLSTSGQPVNPHLATVLQTPNRFNPRYVKVNPAIRDAADEVIPIITLVGMVNAGRDQRRAWNLAAQTATALHKFVIYHPTIELPEVMLTGQPGHTAFFGIVADTIDSLNNKITKYQPHRLGEVTQDYLRELAIAIHVAPIDTK